MPKVKNAMGIGNVRRLVRQYLRPFGVKFKEVKTHENYLDRRPAVAVHGFYLFFGEGGRWVVEKVVYDPGVRYYKDGSGQPPSEDYADVWTDHVKNGSPERAAAQLAYEVITARLNEMMQNSGDDEMARKQNSEGTDHG